MNHSKENEHSEIVKPDLKHDTMEYNAASEGDVPDIVNESAIDDEEEDVTAEELNSLGDDSVQHQAEALISAETDSLTDSDNFINEPDSEVEDPIISETQEPVDKTEDERNSL
jgi:hypothetical protein